MKKFEMLNIICQDCELTSKEKLVAQYFVYKSNKSGACYPCVATIAEECCISRRTVQRATKKLAEKEYIMIEKQFKCGKQTSNLYSFNILLLEEMEREKERIQEEEKAIEPTMEVVDLEELLSIQETVVDAEEENEEIDLDDLVAYLDEEDSVWEEAYNAPFEEQEEETENVEGEQQRMFSFSVAIQVISFICITEQIVVYIVFRYDLINVNSGFLVYQENGASIKIMGAFFPP